MKKIETKKAEALLLIAELRKAAAMNDIERVKAYAPGSIQDAYDRLEEIVQIKMPPKHAVDQKPRRK